MQGNSIFLCILGGVLVFLVGILKILSTFYCNFSIALLSRKFGSAKNYALFGVSLCTLYRVRAKKITFFKSGRKWDIFDWDLPLSPPATHPTFSHFSSHEGLAGHDAAASPPLQGLGGEPGTQESLPLEVGTLFLLLNIRMVASLDWLLYATEKKLIT